MRVPRTLRSVDHETAIVRAVSADGASEITVDFGASAGDLVVDVVGGTVIATTDDDQFEFDLPQDAEDVTANNGVLTIRGPADGN